jgi:hypothetical protein
MCIGTLQQHNLMAGATVMQGMPCVKAVLAHQNVAAVYCV